MVDDFRTPGAEGGDAVRWGCDGGELLRGPAESEVRLGGILARQYSEPHD